MRWPLPTPASSTSSCGRRLPHERSSARRRSAKGILMQSESCTRDQAFDMLRRASQRENRKLRDLAEEIVESKLVPPARPRPCDHPRPTPCWRPPVPTGFEPSRALSRRSRMTRQPRP
ncbi:MAG: ANTAR domain-containing protein [Acidimicrobiales bacterium]